MSLKNKAVLVTGGAGFIGSHLVDALVKQKPEKIVVVDNFFLGSMENLEYAIKNFDKITIYREDASEYTTMENLIIREQIDVVFDLAVKPLPYSFINPEGSYMTSVRIAHVLVSLLRKDVYETLIHFSSSEAYGSAEYVPMDERHVLNPTTPYSAGKAAVDLLILSYYKSFGIDTAIIRPFNNYGPRQNDTTYAAIIPTTIKRILNGKPPILEWDGKQTRDFLYVGDTADAAIRMYDKKNTRGKIINIASGKETEINELIQIITNQLGYKNNILRKPKRPADIRRHCADIRLAKKIMGFEPKTDLQEGIKLTIAWFKRKYKGI